MIEDFDYQADLPTSRSSKKSFRLEDDYLEDDVYERNLLEDGDDEDEFKKKRSRKKKKMERLRSEKLGSSGSAHGFTESKSNRLLSIYEADMLKANARKNDGSQNIPDREFMTLVLLAQAGDEQSEELLIKHNLLYINSKLLQHPMAGHKVVFEDRYSNRDAVWNVAKFGFSQAVRNFDRSRLGIPETHPEYAAQFRATLYNVAGGSKDVRSFRESYIYKVLSEYLSKEVHGLSQDNVLKRKLINEIEEELREELGRDPTNAEIRARHKEKKGTGIGAARVQGLKEHTNDHLSLNQPTGEDGNRELGEAIPDKYVEPSKPIEDLEVRQKIERLITEAPLPVKGYLLGNKFKTMAVLGSHDVRNPPEAGRLWGGGGDRVKSEKALVEMALRGQIATYDPEIYEEVIKKDGTTEIKYTKQYREAYPEFTQNVKKTFRNG